MESAPLIAPLAVDEWFQAMPEVLTPVSWSLALARPNAQLGHRSCPWGGHLIKFDLKNIQIQDAPEKTSNLIVRPEVRAAESGVKGVAAETLKLGLLTVLQSLLWAHPNRFTRQE